MSVRIKVDVRERALIPLLGLALGGDAGEQDAPALDAEPLDVGDVQVWVGDRPWMVYERKTHADLLASLNSGRYVEQRERLKAWCQSSAARPAMLYVLEGPEDAACARVAACACSLLAVHRVAVVWTASLGATARHVAQVARTLQRRAARGTLPAPSQEPSAQLREAAVCAGVAYQKRANVATARQCWVRQLCCIPGVAAGLAERVAERYPGMTALVHMLQEAGTPAAAAVELAKRVQGIGPKLATRVVSLIE